MRGALTPFSNVGEGGCLSEYNLKNKGMKPGLTLVTLHGLIPREPKRRPVWLERRTQDDSGKRTGILDFRPSVPDSGVRGAERKGAGKPLDPTYL